MSETQKEESARILVAEDDAAVAWAVEQALSAEGYSIRLASDGLSAMKQARKERPDLVIADIRMPGLDGLGLLAEIQKLYPQLPVVIMTAHGTMETAIEAVKRGAFDYLPKPLDLERLIATARRALGEHAIAAAASPSLACEQYAMVGSTAMMQEVYRRIAAAAASEVTVLVTGPSGSGKELVARALHRHSRRCEGPFVAVNCGSLPDHLVESELFGHEAGAFTDARGRRIGRTESANGGTLFLDEIGELPLSAQAKLLRFLEDQRIQRVGGNEEIALDVRIVAATNRDLATMVAAGAFREDLAWRLRVFTIHLPPLAERMDDVPALAKHFLSRSAGRLGRSLQLTQDAIERLKTWHWPGNVRELRHTIEEASVIATGGVISADLLSLPAPDPGANRGDLPRLMEERAKRLIDQTPGEVATRMQEELEHAMIRAALAKTEGNQLRAAELLGINRMTLKKRMDELGIRKG